MVLQSGPLFPSCTRETRQGGRTPWSQGRAPHSGAVVIRFPGFADRGVYYVCPNTKSKLFTSRVWNGCRLRGMGANRSGAEHSKETALTLLLNTDKTCGVVVDACLLHPSFGSAWSTTEVSLPVTWQSRCVCVCAEYTVSTCTNGVPFETNTHYRFRTKICPSILTQRWRA